MNINPIKNSLLVGLLLIISAVTTTALAANVWKLDGKTVKPGAKDTIHLQLDNADEATSFQFDITLPEGVLLTGAPRLSERSDVHDLNWKAQTESVYRIIAFSPKNIRFKGNSGTLVSIPVQYSKSFEGGQLALSQMVLVNKKSQKLDISASLQPISVAKELQRISLIVSNLEQVVSDKADASIMLSTIPADIQGMNIQYFTDDSCTLEATDRKKEGIYFVKITRAEDATYHAVSEIYTMVLNSKRIIDQVTAPTATPIVAGQFLSASILKEGSATWEKSPVPGSFVWANANAIANATGKYKAIFFPDDNLNYNSKEVDVDVTVTPTYIISIVNPAEGGVIKVEGRTPNDVYVAGQSLKLNAIPDAGYAFAGWIGSDQASASLTIQASGDMTISAQFKEINHTVSMSAQGGQIEVVTEGGKPVESGNALPEGTVLSIKATPDPGKRLKEIKVNEAPFTTGKYKLLANTAITASFESIPISMYIVTASVKGDIGGTIRLYTEAGAPIVSGNTLGKDAVFTVVPLPNAGYELSNMNVTGATSANGKYKVTGTVQVTAEFEAKTFHIVTQKTGNGADDATLTVTPSGSQPYGTPISVAVEEKNGATLKRLVANGKEIQQGTPFALTSDLTITAEFTKKVNIEREYLIQSIQRFVYNGMSRNFMAYATQTYAFFSFDVKYKKKDSPDLLDKAVDAGSYDVVISRPADELYNAFEETYDGRLLIDKSRILVLKAPEMEGDVVKHYGVTRPSLDNDEINKSYTAQAGKEYVKIFSYMPKAETSTATNYEGVNYYLSTSDVTVPLSVGSNILRSAANEGAVRVTNGNLPYTADQLVNLTQL